MDSETRKRCEALYDEIQPIGGSRVKMLSAIEELAEYAERRALERAGDTYRKRSDAIADYTPTLKGKRRQAASMNEADILRGVSEELLAAAQALSPTSPDDGGRGGVEHDNALDAYLDTLVEIERICRSYGIEEERGPNEPDSAWYPSLVDTAIRDYKARLFAIASAVRPEAPNTRTVLADVRDVVSERDRLLTLKRSAVGGVERFVTAQDVLRDPELFLDANVPESAVDGALREMDLDPERLKADGRAFVAKMTCRGCQTCEFRGGHLLAPLPEKAATTATQRTGTRPEREGPQRIVEHSCQGCSYEASEYYAVQGDSGWRVYCAHPSVGRKSVGDSTWQTPTWCPLLAPEPQRPGAGVECAECEGSGERWRRVPGERAEESYPCPACTKPDGPGEVA